MNANRKAVTLTVLMSVILLGAFLVASQNQRQDEPPATRVLAGGPVPAPRHPGPWAPVPAPSPQNRSVADSWRPSTGGYTVSPTLGLEELIAAFESEVVADAQRVSQLAAARRKMQEERDRGVRLWGAERWMREPAYYHSLTTRVLACECFARPLFGYELSIFDEPLLGYYRLEIFHNGFTELFRRPDLWEGILSAYEYLGEQISLDTDLRTIIEVSSCFDAMPRFYCMEPFRSQVKGRERLFLSANLKVLEKYRWYLDHLGERGLSAGAGTGFFGEPCGIARVALMLASTMNPQGYEQIKPLVTSVRWSEEQKVSELRDYLDLVITAVDSVVERDARTIAPEDGEIERR